MCIVGTSVLLGIITLLVLVLCPFVEDEDVLSIVQDVALKEIAPLEKNTKAAAITTNSNSSIAILGSFLSLELHATDADFPDFPEDEPGVEFVATCWRDTFRSMPREMFFVFSRAFRALTRRADPAPGAGDDDPQAQLLEEHVPLPVAEEDVRPVVPIHEIRSLRFPPTVVGKDGASVPPCEPSGSAGQPEQPSPFVYIGEWDSFLEQQCAIHLPEEEAKCRGKFPLQLAHCFAAADSRLQKEEFDVLWLQDPNGRRVDYTFYKATTERAIRDR